MKIKELPPTNKLRNTGLAMKIDKTICSHDIAPFPNVTGARVLVIGQPGAGKSSMVMQALKSKHCYRKRIDNIYVLSPKNSVNSVSDPVFEKLDPSKLIHEFDEEILDDLLGKLEANKDEDETSLVIIDDWASSLKEKEIEKRLNHICANCRHLNTILFILVQSFRFLPNKVRKMFSDVVLVGRPKNKMEILNLSDEVFFMDTKDVKQLMKYTFRNKHDFMWIGEKSIYRNYQRLEIDEEDEKT